MPVIKKPVKAKKTKKSPKPVSRALVKAKPAKKSQDPTAYYECMKACCKNKLKGKKITRVAHECKTNALAINAKMSAQKTQAVKKIKAGYEQLGKGLSEFIKAA